VRATRSALFETKAYEKDKRERSSNLFCHAFAFPAIRIFAWTTYEALCAARATQQDLPFASFAPATVTAVAIQIVCFPVLALQIESALY
jgi:hypothetical protein